MRRRIVVGALGGFLVATAIAAELVITTFNSTGDLTWTNSFATNATYRVEWAGSATGPWQKFDTLTNLTLLSATSNVVTVKVPTFYRVIWLDAPPYAGDWSFFGSNMQGSLLVTGRFSLSAANFPITGTWSSKRPAGSTSIFPRDGSGWVDGAFQSNKLSINLYYEPDQGDHLRFEGIISANTCTGIWFHGGIALNPIGPFVAEKQGVAP